MTNNNLERKGFDWLISWGTESITKVKIGTQGNNMETGLKQGPWKKVAYWLAPKAFYTSQNHLHRSSTAHSRVGPL